MLQAKLTATLTLAEFKSSVSSIDDAVARSWKICVTAPVATSLKELFPNVKGLLVPTEDFKEPGRVHAGDCQAFIGFSDLDSFPSHCPMVILFGSAGTAS